MTLVIFKSKKSLAIINKKRSRHIPLTVKKQMWTVNHLQILLKEPYKGNEITDQAQVSCISQDLDHFH